MSKKQYSVLFILFFSLNAAFAQNARFSLDLNAGIPLPLASIKSNITTYGGVGVRYNLTSALSIEGMLNMGTMAGSQTPAVPIPVYPNVDNENVANYHNNFVQYSLKGLVNLERVFGLRKVFHRINPYVTGGLGFINSSVSTNFSNGYQYKVNRSFFTGYVGLQFKYYINPSLDFNIGSEMNLTETYYLDGAATDKKYDYYLLNYVGVAYKFGARKDKQHIEWNNVILKDRIYIPHIEKRQGQPLDAAGNFFIFHKDSIALLQTQNRELQQKTVMLEQKSAEQQKQIDSMKQDMSTMKVKVDTLQNQVSQMQEQMNKPPQVVYAPAPEKAPEPVKPTPPPATTQVPAKPKPKPAKSQLPQTPAQPEKVTAPEVTTKAPEPKQPEKVEAPAKQKETPVITTVPEKPVETAPVTELNQIDGVVAPIARYNVVAGAYAGEKYAFIFRDKMRAKGYEAAIFKSDINSKILRVCLFTTQDKEEAMRMMRKVRAEVDPKAWVHVYYEK